MNLRPGSILQSGKYEILEVLGQGGFGITYLAQHTLLQDKVAIKEFFPKDYCNREEHTGSLTVATRSNVDLVEKLRIRFVNEARILSRLNNPGIVNIHDIFEENNSAYYVMEFIEGKSLESIIESSGPLEESVAIDYIRKVGEALDYIHRNKMLHFDVKPGNIMINRKDGKPVLIDFGLSKQYNDKGYVVSTLLMGVSTGYSPIEQYSQEEMETFTPQSDIYSLSATLYNLLTGRQPPAAPKLLGKTIEVPINISESTAKAIKWGMSPLRDNRPSTVAEFLKALPPSNATSNNSRSGGDGFSGDEASRTGRDTVLAQPYNRMDKRSTIVAENRNSGRGGGRSGGGGNFGGGRGGDTVIAGTNYSSGGRDNRDGRGNNDNNGKRNGTKLMIFLLFVIIAVVVGIILVNYINRPSSRYASDYGDTIVDHNGELVVEEELKIDTTAIVEEEPEYDQPEEEWNEDSYEVNPDRFPGVFSYVAKYGIPGIRDGERAYYYSGYFSDDYDDYAVKVCFVVTGNNMRVIYKNVAKNVAPMDMAVIQNSSSLTLRNERYNFDMDLWPDENGVIGGVADQSTHHLYVHLEPSTSTF